MQAVFDFSNAIEHQKEQIKNMEKKIKIGTFDYDKYDKESLLHISTAKTLSVGIYKWELKKGKMFRSQSDLKKSKAFVRVTMDIAKLKQGMKVVEHITQRLNNKTYECKASVNANVYAKKNNIQ